jgi:hypothetical protein
MNYFCYFQLEIQVGLLGKEKAENSQEGLKTFFYLLLTTAD